MGARFRQWLKDVAARLAAQAVVTIMFATIPIIFTMWEWRGIIVQDHKRQLVLDSLLVQHLEESARMKERIGTLEWQRRNDSARIDVRFEHIEKDVDVLKRSVLTQPTITKKEKPS